MQAEHVDATAEFNDASYHYADLIKELPDIRGKSFSEIELDKIIVVAEKILSITSSSHDEEAVLGIEELALLSITIDYVQICSNKTDLRESTRSEEQKLIIRMLNDLQRSYKEMGESLRGLVATTKGKKKYDSTRIALRRVLLTDAARATR